MADAYKFIENSKSRTGEGAVALTNSSTTPLVAASTFVGSTDECFMYSTVSCSVKSDQDGMLYIEQSQDSTAWDFSKSFPYTAGSGELHSATISARYCRVRFTNSSANDQTYIRLQTIFHLSKQVETSSISAKQVIDEDADCKLTRLVNDFDLDLRLGKMVSRKLVNVFGYAPRVRTAFTEMINDTAQGSVDLAATCFLSTALGVRVKAGGNVNDAEAGTGARSVVISGLDANFQPVSETVATAGASASLATTATFLRVFSAEVVDVGAYGGKNAGDISIETSGGALMCRIIAGLSKSQKGAYTDPSGRTCYLRYIRNSVPSDKLATVQLLSRAGADVNTAPYTPVKCVYKTQTQGTSADDGPKNYSVMFPEKTDIWVSAISEGADIRNISSDFELLEITNQQ